MQASSNTGFERDEQASAAAEAVVEVAVFRVGSEEYLIDLHRVREIIRPMPITPVRKAPRFVEGVIDLRGTIIPVIDLRKRFELPTVANTPDTRFLIAVVNGSMVGLVVDEATDIMHLPRSSIKQPPAMLHGDQAPFFLGVCNHKGRLMTLLNLKQVLMSNEPIPLARTADGRSVPLIGADHG